jgi:glycerol kinase
MSLILAIDQSTSATKVMLFDESGTIVDKTSRKHRQIYPQPGWVEHDAEEIWQNLLTATEELCERNRDALAEVVGVSIAIQRETFVVFDKQSGTPLHNAIVWQCRRGDALCRKLVAEGHEPMVQANTGLKLDSYFPASKIDWLLRETSDLAAKLRSGEAVVSTIDAYLVSRLTAGKEFATDHTNASRTLLYDVHKLAWDESLCNLFGVPLQALPTVRDCAADYGQTDVGGALPKVVPICGVMGDSQASLFAQRCFQPGSGKATFGTGTSVLINIGHHASVKCAGSVLALAWVLDGKPTYALEGIINYSSATIAWLRDQLELLTDAAECETLAREVEDNGGVYLVPAFAGLSAPNWNPDARAAIVGMTGHTTKAHIVRAALESISYQIRDVVDMISAEANIMPQAMFADGGPTQNELLMQLTADMTQLEWCVSDIAESSALGAAFAGMLQLDLHDSVAALTSLPRSERRFAPQMSLDDANAQQAGWRRAVKRVL